MQYLFFLSVDITFVAYIDFHLAGNVLCELWPVRIQRGDFFIRELRTADQLSQGTGCLELGRIERAEDLLIGSGGSDPDLFQSLNLFCYFLLLIADVIILVLRDQAFLIAIFTKSQIGIVLSEQ